MDERKVVLITGGAWVKDVHMHINMQKMDLMLY